MKYPITSALLTVALATSSFSARALPDDEGDHKPACMQGQRENRTERLKEALQLTPQQQDAWNSYSDSLRRRGQDRHLPQQDLASTRTPERLQLMREQRKANEAEFERRAAATETFYAVLDEEQRKVFDKLSARYFRRAAHWKHR
ncbi:MAG: Spy/CpxP family protein refolding chaperone [Hylemonella sp.]|nr:Spy/CpxP family protein refolding chaperone [Hylemonella sp.]